MSATTTATTTFKPSADDKVKLLAEHGLSDENNLPILDLTAPAGAIGKVVGLADVQPAEDDPEYNTFYIVEFENGSGSVHLSHLAEV